MTRTGEGSVLKLERLELDRVDWERLDAFDDRLIFQTRPWLEFVRRTQGAEPVVAAVLDAGDTVVGYFTGLVVRRFGVRILGSPFPGWTTSYMGFNLQEGVPREEAARAVLRFAFGELRCWHLELKDRFLAPESVRDLAFEHTPNQTFEIDLAVSEEEMFGRMTSACRRAIRKSEKVGVLVEEAAGDDGFADEYYAQLEDVFAKQGLSPTYDVTRVRELIAAVHPTGQLLLLRARSPEGLSIATGLFPGLGGTAYFWGGASWREHQALRPNEAIFWHAMRYWKARGVTTMDMGGGGDYKRKYGPIELNVPFFRKSRIRGLGTLRELARRRMSTG
jgi:CelD/BcsL family acetyltransferase involved in cellulose biosynthesis